MEEKKNKRTWLPIAEDGTSTEFLEMLEKAKLPPELAKEVQNQITEAQNADNPNIVFVFSEGNYVVTAIHVPTESLNGQDGPVLMKGATENHIFAAFSADYIREKIKNADSLEEDAGLSGIADNAWMNELERLVEVVRLELAANPPDSWESLLD
jgi:hypothetical protein